MFFAGPVPESSWAVPHRLIGGVWETKMGPRSMLPIARGWGKLSRNTRATDWRFTTRCTNVAITLAANHRTVATGSAISTAAT